MDTCLTESERQAVADGEGSPAHVDHVRICPACSERVTDARAAIADFSRGLAAVEGADRRGGATTLRRQPRARSSRSTWALASGAAAAAVVLMFVLFPSIDPTPRLNASEILDRSLQTLTATGTERLVYELSVELPGASPIENGTFRIEQVIDHQTGRWRFSRYTADGVLLNGIAEDPSRQQRETLVRLDDRQFRFRFGITPEQQVKLWDWQRRIAETMIRLVQASGAHVITDDGADGQRYIVELPETAAAQASPLFDLNRARIVIDASDFHVVEFTASGSAMNAPVSVGYLLLTRTVAGSLPSSEFELPRDGVATIELSGEGTAHVPHDVINVLLREIMRLQP